MDQMNGHQNNEKMLFHGTREDSISHINQNGFNRSYAGKNGMLIFEHNRTSFYELQSLVFILTPSASVARSTNLFMLIDCSCSLWKRNLLCA